MSFPFPSLLFQVGFITLLSDPNNLNSPYLTLSSESVSITRYPTHTIVVRLGQTDIDFIQSVQPDLLSSASNSYLSYLAGAFCDIARPPNQIIVNYFRYGIPVSLFTKDSAAPHLLYWNFSIPDARINFFFNKRVNCSKTKIGKIIVQARKFEGTLTDEIYTLSATKSGEQLSTRVSCNSSQFNDAHVLVLLGLNDLLNFKTSPTLVKGPDSTFLRFLDDAVLIFRSFLMCTSMLNILLVCC